MHTPTAEGGSILDSKEKKLVTKQIERGAASLPVPQGDQAAVSPQAIAGLFRADSLSISFRGEALSALSMARTKGVVNPITKNSVTVGNVTIASSNPSALGIGAQKLLRYSVSAFAAKNAQNERKPTLRVYGDTKDFARANGVSIDPQIMPTPEEQEKEDQRAAKAMENFLAKLGRNAKSLKSNASFSWSETVRGRETSFSGLSLIGAYKIDADVMMIEFTQSAAEYMTQLPLSDTPRALYAVDDRKPNAYAIAEALISHYGIENNVIRDTERMMKVETLLRYTSFPSLEAIKEKKQRHGWQSLVKEPFEAALDELKRAGLLSDWEYRLPGKVELTDEEAESIDRYEQFISLYVYYTLSEYKPHEERLKLIMQRREESKERTAQRREKKRKRTTQDSKDK